MDLDKYDLIEKPIGFGSYGKVFRGKVKETGQDIAVKFIDKGKYDRKERKSFHKECGIHAKLQHPNIIKMINSFETPEHIIVVTELAGTDLHNFMKHTKLSEAHVRKLTGNLLSALYYLHSKRILHRDLKPHNILLNNHHDMNCIEAKLCDFGLARNMTPETFLLTSVKGTPIYMAPELILNEIYDERADLWSVGCVLYEALFGRPPFKTQSLSQLIELLKKAEIKWPMAVSIECKSLLENLLKRDPKQRPTWSQIKEHPYVKDILLIINDDEMDCPLTQTLTDSQQIRKQRQRDEIILNRDKKMIAQAMSKCAQLNPTEEKMPMGNDNKNKHIIGDNESISSADSINAIIQTDLETDVEGPVIRKQIKKTKSSVEPMANHNFVIKPFAENFAASDAALKAAQDNQDDGNNLNLKIGTLFENLQLEEEAKWIAMKTKQMNNESPGHSSDKAIDGHSHMDLARRKLSQNLDNFSIKWNNSSFNSKKSVDEFDKDKSKEKQSFNENSKTMTETEKSDSKMDTYSDQCSPMENEEWLAFIQMTMHEVLNEEYDTLKNSNLVGMIVAILRNFNANTEVIGAVVQLLSIPFVLPLSNEDITEIKEVYIQMRLLPNLVFASKMICTVREGNQALSSSMSSSDLVALSTTQENVVFKKMNNMSNNHLKTMTNIYELICHLIHSNDHFLPQLCDAVFILAMDLLRHILSDVVYDNQGMQLISVIIAILCFLLRKTPENCVIVEDIVFSSKVSLVELLKNGNALLKTRLCMLLRIIGRFCCSSLQKAWTVEFKETLEGLADGDNETVRDTAKCAIAELEHLSFYELELPE